MVVLVGCYQPAAITPCAFTCTAATDCPDPATMACNPTTQRCQLVGGGCGAGVEPDAANQRCVASKMLGPVCVDGGAVPPFLEIAIISAEIETDTDPRCGVIRQSSGADVCVIAAGQISIATRLRATGSRPLALVALTGDIQLAVNASIDVSSLGPDVGAASGGKHCEESGIGGGGSADGGGGGAGGSYQGQGGTGGASDGSARDGVRGGAPQSPVGHGSTLAGGCAGGHGGTSVMIDGFGAPGGGAVALIATGNLVINGHINASGAGGAGCTAVGDNGGGDGGGGGGGGGAGGMILLEGQRLEGGGRLVANGGGGGGGCSTASGGTGGIASADAPNVSALAGTGGAGGAGDGGAGSAGSNLDGGLAVQGGTRSGGGGGGGGAGHILVNVTTRTLLGTVSPPSNPL